jgi:hypothetical protein
MLRVVAQVGISAVNVVPLIADEVGQVILGVRVRYTVAALSR